MPRAKRARASGYVSKNLDANDAGNLKRFGKQRGVGGHAARTQDNTLKSIAFEERQIPRGKILRHENRFPRDLGAL